MMRVQLRSGLALVAALGLIACGEDAGVAGPSTPNSTNAADGTATDAVAGTDTTTTDGSASDIAASDIAASDIAASDIAAGSTDGGGQTGSDASAPDAVGQFVCVNHFDCEALLTNLPPCQIGKCINNICTPGARDEGAKCSDDGPCTSAGTCVDGACEGGGLKCADKTCMVATCDQQTGDCSYSPATGDAEKCDDGSACTSDDTCKDGKCAGTAQDCDDNNPCTDDVCAADAGGCSYKHNNKPCGDGGKCAGAGTCKAGQCEAGKAIGCDDDNACTDDKCDAATGTCVFDANDKVTCDDDNACTKSDLCTDGKCVGSANKVCNDDNACTDDICDPASGDCVHTANSAACDDGNACTTDDSCKNAGCTGEKLKLCNDGKACTNDACDPKTGCVTSFNTAPCADDAKCLLGTCKDGGCEVGADSGCNDNNLCTSDACVAGKCQYKDAGAGTCKDGDKCQAASLCEKGVCKPGKVTDCDDANVCTTDSCDPKAGCSWQSSSEGCDDGNACTTEDSCATGKCKGVDKKGLCDDANVCTSDSCDAKKGCVHAPTEAACDDGNVCTKNEACTAGKCGGGTADQCADGKPCTVDSCDPKTGKCSWTGKSGACDDGNECTANDHCKIGKCVSTEANTCDDSNVCTADSCDEQVGKCAHKPVADADKPTPCDDNNKCTKVDACAQGSCVGGQATVCDDGNKCTADKCNPTTGTCGFSPNSAPCDSGDPCTFGDACSNGKCGAGTGVSCDDGNPCTTDTCDAKTGACAHKALPEKTVCDDGEACSTGDACAAGKCVAKDRTKCALFSDSFQCSGAKPGWTLQNTKGRAVIWAVDSKPSVGKAEWGCSMNFNNNVNYCDKYTTSNGSSACHTPTGIAYSPVIDGGKIQGTPRLIFDTYYDVDAQGDNPRVELRRASNNQYLYGFNLAKGESKKWRHMEVNVPQVKGQQFRVRFYLSGASGSSGNTGKGFFVDNLTVDQQYTAEVCNDGVDNDNNGQTDCADIACKGKSTCKEVCDDNKDNDYDDQVDCADADCKTAVECTKPIFEDGFACAGDPKAAQQSGWTFADMKRNDVKFAIDSGDGGPKPVSGACTMNFNNNSNFCGVKSCANGSNNANAGLATWAKEIDATKYKSSLTLVYWSWIDGEPQSGSAYYDDRGFVQASFDGFSGCCGATNACTAQTLNVCNKTATSTWIAPRQSYQQKKWQKVTLNLYKFRGKKFQLRLRFNSGDGNNNAFKGWFVDDLRIYGK